MVSTIVITLVIALIVGGLIGLLLGGDDERGFSTFAGLVVGFNIWLTAWGIVVIVHFVSKFW